MLQIMKCDLETFNVNLCAISQGYTFSNSEFKFLIADLM